MVSTLPGEPPPESHAWLSDQPSWCVDTGPTLKAMSTCDLWLGLAKGEIHPEMKVWREGMACWEPVRQVAEFALALPDERVWTPTPAGIAAVRAEVARIRSTPPPPIKAARSGEPRAAAANAPVVAEA